MYKGKEILFGRGFALLGGVMSIVSGGLVNTFFRTAAVVLSISANATSWLAEKIFIDLDDEARPPAKTPLDKAKNWAAGHQVLISGVQKIGASSCFATSGYVNNNHAEMGSGLMYLTAGIMELSGEKGRGYWLTSTALSGVGATLVIAAGCKPGEIDPALIVGGTSYLLGSASLALANPKKYTSFRDKIDAERSNKSKDMEI